MNITEFKNLTQEEKISRIVFSSTYVGHRLTKSNTSVYLHYHNGVFVEVSHISSRINSAIIYAITWQELIESYLSFIDISDINN